MRLVPVFTLETNNECLPKFVQTHNASSSIKRSLVVKRRCFRGFVPVFRVFVRAFSMSAVMFQISGLSEKCRPLDFA